MKALLSTSGALFGHAAALPGNVRCECWIGNCDIDFLSFAIAFRFWVQNFLNLKLFEILLLNFE